MSVRPSARAKRPVTRVAGPYGHPLHPLLVTVPIGAWVSSFVFDLAQTWAGEPEVFVKGAAWLVVIGLAGAALAAAAGVLDLLAIPPRTTAFRTAATHMIINLLVIAGYGISAGIRFTRFEEPGVAVGLVALNAASLALLGFSGWLGGRLTYRFGVRVADEYVQQKEGFGPPGRRAAS